MPDQPVPTKLVMMIVGDTDADDLLAALTQHHFSATKIGSTGGFLRRGSVTIFSGVEESQVDAVIAVVNEICPVRMEMVPIETSPFVDETGYSKPIEVRTGGAIVFVLNVDRFQRI
ncbi:MAG: hypothetical protein DWI58_10130 [Chloroflexi bacterium]|nr:MAG: hypothetical protein DWI58_10130 [Chloroflexota bacterium]